MFFFLALLARSLSHLPGFFPSLCVAAQVLRSRKHRGGKLTEARANREPWQWTCGLGKEQVSISLLLDTLEGAPTGPCLGPKAETPKNGKSHT